MGPCQSISHIQVLVTNFFPTQPIKLELGLQIGGRLLIQTHLDQSNYVPHQEEHRGVNEYKQFTTGLTHEPHPRVLVQGHILSVGGDALTIERSLFQLERRIMPGTPYIDIFGCFTCF
jgi:hypothetical protein